MYNLIILLNFSRILLIKYQIIKITPSQDMNNSPLILIYLNFKGYAQIIRYLLRYLEIPYTEIFLDQYDKQKKTLSAEVKEILKGKAIIQNDLPAIIHENQTIYELNMIMRYICINFQREDILGTSIYNKARVCQFMEIFSRKIRTNVLYIFQFIGMLQFGGYQGQRLLQFLDQKFTYLLQNSGYFLEMSTYLISQKNRKFVLGQLTILDFFFNQICKFCIILFGNISDQLASPSWMAFAKGYQSINKAKGVQNRTCQILKVMKEYQDFYEGQEFYKKDQAYFDSFAYFPNIMDEEGHKQALDKLKSIDFLETLYHRPKLV